MRNEAWPDAAKSFQQAIETDREFEDAYYGLGLAQMRMKKYAEAIAAYVKCRDLYRAQAGKKFTNTPGRAALQAGPPDRNRRADSPDANRAPVADLAGPRSPTSGSAPPDSGFHLRGAATSASKTLSLRSSRWLLGSAYFRTEQLPDAEREYKAAIAADPKKGEAYSNLAVVYLQTGRYKEADDAVKSAEKAGYKVHPQLKQDIKAKMAG